VKYLEKIDGFLDSSIDEIIDLQRILTAIPAISPESGGEWEKKKADSLRRILDRMGLGPVADFPAPDERVPSAVRPNLVIKRKGRKSDRTIWIMSHLDVVPPGDLKNWNSDPYELRREGDLIYGRGVEDNHQGLVASVFALKAIVNLELQTEHDIGCIFVADEETGSKFGIQYLLKEHPEIFGKNDLVLVPDSGNPEGTLVEVAEKSILWLKITTRGKQCHASRPYNGKNAFVAASELVIKIRELYKAFPVIDSLFDPPYSTFEPTKKEPNVPNINTIPGTDVFYVDCRIMPSIQIEEVVSWIRKKANRICKKHGVDMDFEFIQKEQAAPPTPADSPLVTALKEAIRQVHGKEGQPMGIGGGTVAAYFRRHGLHAVVWSTLSESAHQANEFCKLSNLIKDARVFARVLLKL